MATVGVSFFSSCPLTPTIVLSWLPPASSLLVANTVLSVLSRFFSLALLSFHAGFMLLLQWKRCKWVRDLRFNTLRSDRLLILSPHLPVSSVFASLPLCVTLSEISFPSIFMFKTAQSRAQPITPRCLLFLSECLHIHLWRAPAFVSGHLSCDWLRHGLEAQRLRGRE